MAMFFVVVRTGSIPHPVLANIVKSLPATQRRKNTREKRRKPNLAFQRVMVDPVLTTAKRVGFFYLSVFHDKNT
jgi:hypothetical protein